MKIALAFISNSSSQSFTCDICGCTYSGTDASLSDAEMVASEYGCYCDSHLLKPFTEIVESYSKADPYAYIDDLRYEMQNEYCPLYNLKYIEDATLFHYLLRTSGKSNCDLDTLRELLCQEIRNKFSNLQKVLDYNHGDKTYVEL